MRISPPAGPLPGVCKAPATRLSYWQRARDGVEQLKAHYGKTPVWIGIAICLALLVGGSYQIGDGLRVIVKAHLAQALIQHAWQRNTTGGEASIKPWPWADMAPIARMTFERQQTALFVLDNDAPRTLAFGPGLHPQSSLPGRGARSVLSAHRDTHFAVLEHVVPGDIIRIETLEGRTLRYEITEQQIVDKHDLWVLNNRGRDELTLVTCWPFSALVPRGPDRLIVTAERLPEKSIVKPVLRQWRSQEVERLKRLANRRFPFRVEFFDSDRSSYCSESLRIMTINHRLRWYRVLAAITD